MAGSTSGQRALIDRVRRARRDRTLAVIEGFHALKHALRFGAEITAALAADEADLQLLARALAPDLAERLSQLAVQIGPDALAELAPRAARTGVVALARRPGADLSTLLAEAGPAPVVMLDEPRDMGNTGACVRVAAAADAAGVIVTGRHDPWHADAIRGSAGLHFALPVIWAPAEALAGRPLVAMDPDGEPLLPAEVPQRAILAFGSERQGLSQTLLERADLALAIPMRDGVSSLNLATSVAATLFALRLCG